MTIAPQSRLHILDKPVALPGKCSLCGDTGSDNRKFIDFGLQLDWYGAVYFCSECIKELAQAINYISLTHFESQARELSILQIKYDQLEARNKAVENALRIILGRSSDPIDSIVGDVVASVEESDSIVEPNKEHDGGDSKAEQSSSVEGPDDIFDADDFE